MSVVSILETKRQEKHFASFVRWKYAFAQGCDGRANWKWVKFMCTSASEPWRGTEGYSSPHSSLSPDLVVIKSVVHVFELFNHRRIFSSAFLSENEALNCAYNYLADSHESRTIIGVPLGTPTDLASHGFYLDKCIDLIEGFHAIHSFPYVELETKATEADIGPFWKVDF